MPEAFEWIHDLRPDLLAVARSASLDVLLAPLLVLDPHALVPDLPVPDATIRLLDPDASSFAADLRASRAVASLGFGTPATVAAGLSTDVLAAGTLSTDVAGPRERDAAGPLDPELITASRAKATTGQVVSAVVHAPSEGILATGLYQRVGDVAEIAGVATLPSARQRGYASQLTATLARHALQNGVTLVFLSAGDDDVARLYARIGFRRVGTACIAEPHSAPPL
ncbi:hypothetical protein GCM10012284_01070 [Mangrovihabitans endophyticus]|uniref:N-acetyltransferase domain-containing protein n=2 Tax=Mangrovihabitans endophyticus TaxID=1751298 RepID=A0A8J3BRN0_9ACTN|nr:hypothetical protein GCM10012284_01070 [Mangrovihabitans endophyticus]